MATTGHELEAINVQGLKASLQKLKTDIIDGKIASTEKGAASGVATLDSAGKVPSSQLPSYVDDVLEYDTKSAFPKTGEGGKIYVDKSNNTTWRWSGTAYTQIKGDLAIGTTTGTAADGGTASAHYSNTSNPHGVTKAQVGLDNVVNTGDSATPVSGGTTKFTTGGAYTELAKKVDKVSGKGLSTNDYTTDEKNKLAGIESGAQTHKAPTSAEVKSALGTGSGTSKYLREDGTWETPPNDDTKNTAGTTNKTGTKMFLAAATEQGANPQTYSNSNCYIGTDNCLYSGGTKVLTSETYTGTVTKVKVGASGTEYSPTNGIVTIPAYPTTLPASDVSSWAKASTKPSYTLSEVGYSASVVAISSATSSSCSITGAGNTGKQQTIIYTNSTGGDLVVTVPTTYTTPDGQAIELTCPSGGYVEVSYINISGTIYARGL